MAEFRLPASVLLIPLVIFGLVVGFRRAWARELITGLVLIGLLLGFTQALDAIRSLFRRLGGLDEVESRLPDGAFELGCLLIFIVGAYWLGNTLGHAGGQGSLNRLVGAVIGVLNVLLLVTVISVQVREVLGPVRASNLALVPGSARAVGVVVPPFPSTNELVQWSVYALVVLVLIAFGRGLTRRPRPKGKD